MVGKQTREVKCAAHRKMGSDNLSIKRKMAVSDADMLSPARGKVKSALPEVMTEIELIVHRKADTVDKKAIKFGLAQVVSACEGGRRTYTCGINFIEPIKNQRNVHPECRHVFAPPNRDLLVLFPDTYVGCTQLAAVAVFHRKSGEITLISHRRQVLIAVVVTIVTIAQADPGGV